MLFMSVLHAFWVSFQQLVNWTSRQLWFPLGIIDPRFWLLKPTLQTYKRVGFKTF